MILSRQFEVQGRYVQLHNNGDCVYDWPCVAIVAHITGTRAVGALMDGGGSYFAVEWADASIDNKPLSRRVLSTYKHSLQCYWLAENLHPNRHYKLRLVKRSEAYLETAICRYCPVRFRGLVLGDATGMSTIPPAPKSSPLRIEFVGDSDLAGFGLCSPVATPYNSIQLRGELQDADMAFGALAAKSLGADYRVLAWSGKGVSSQNVLTSGTEKIIDLYARNVASESWRGDIQPEDSWHPDLVVIYAGANDFAYWTTPSVEYFADAYVSLIQEINYHHPDARVLCLTLNDWHNLTASEWGSSVQRWIWEQVRSGVTHATRACPLGGRVHHHSLGSYMNPILDPNADFGLLMHWNQRGHEKMSRALLDVLSKHQQT